MATFPFPLPTTGSLSFTDFLIDPSSSSSSSYTTHLAEANSARANLRAILKEERRTESSERDALGVVKAIEAYLPYFYSISACLKTDDLLLRSEPVFSWRATLTSTLHPNPPRHTFPSPSLLAEETFLLLTYLYALSNLSSSILLSLSLDPSSSSSPSSSSASNWYGVGGGYELDQTLSTAERKKKDERLGQAADLLCRASGVGEYLGERVVGEWERERAQIGGGGGQRGGKGKGPAEESRGFVLGLAKMLLASAHLLSLRRLLSPTLSLSPHLGPPLPRSHPSPSLLSKLYLHTTSLFTTSLSLLSSSPPTTTDPPSPSLLRWVKSTGAMAEALSRKWLGVDAGENGGGERTGEAIVWLREARRGLESVGEGEGGLKKLGSSSGSGGSSGGGLFSKAKKVGKEEKREREGRIGIELQGVEAFLNVYEKANDTVYFSPLPPLSSLLPRIPAGRAVLNFKPFSPPKPIFGPGSDEYVGKASNAIGEDGVERLEAGVSGRRVDERRSGGGEGYF